MNRNVPLFVFLLGILSSFQATGLWTVIDIMGSNQINFDSGLSTAPDDAYPAVDFHFDGEAIFGSGGFPVSLVEGYSIGLWAKREATGTEYSLLNIYDSSDVGVFSIFMPSDSSVYPFTMYTISDVVHTKADPTAFNYNDYYAVGSWLFIFFSYNINTRTTFGYLFRPSTADSLPITTLDPLEDLKVPETSSMFYIGGDRLQTMSSRGTISQVRFYLELFTNDEAIMKKFYDFGVETFEFLSFTPLDDDSQTFAVDQVYVTVTVGAVESLTTNSASGTLGLTSDIEATLDPTFGPYYISCRGNQIASYIMMNFLSENTAIILVFRIPISAPSSSSQTILSFQTGTTVVYRINYDSGSKSLQFNSGGNERKTNPNTITPGTWYTAVITSYLPRDASTRTFKVYLNNGDNAEPLTGTSVELPYIPSTNAETAIYICGTSDGSGVTNGGYVDIVRLEILSPAGDIYPEAAGDPSCSYYFHYGNVMQTCAFCNDGYFFYQGHCTDTCEYWIFGHSETSSCLSCGSPTNHPQTTDALADLPFPTVTLSLEQGGSTVSSISIESCQTLTLTAILSSESGCSPYKYLWSYESNSSNPTAQEALNNFVSSVEETATTLNIPAETLEFGVAYNFTFIIENLNNVKSAPTFLAFTTIGGHGCSPIGPTCVAPLSLYKNECVDQCPPYYKVIIRSDPIWGDTRYCLSGKDVKMQVFTTSLPTQIILQFSEPILSLLPNPETQLFINIHGFALDESNYTFSIFSNKTIQIDFNFEQRIPRNSLATVGFAISYLQTVTQVLMEKNYRLINQNASIKLLEYYPFSPAQQAMISTTNDFSSIAGPIITATLVASQIAGGSSSFILGAAFACELIQLYKYIDTDYPPNLLLLFDGSFESPIKLQLPISLDSLNIEIDTDVYLNVHDGSKFEIYEMSPYFIQNGISELATIILLLGLLGLVIGLKKIKRIRSRFRKYLNKLESFICWNYILLTIISANTAATLYLAVNIGNPDYFTDLGRFCFILSIALSLGICMLIFVLSQFVMKKFKEITTNSYYPRRKLTQQELIQKRKDKRLDVVIEEYETNKFWQAAYIPLFLVRTSGVSVILVLFKFYGLSAALSIEALNLWFLAYLIHHKPLKDKGDLYVQITYEIFNAVIGFIIVILRFLDISGDTTSDSRMNCGWAIIGLNFAVLGFSAILGIASAASTIIKGIKWLKSYLENRRNRKTVSEKQSKLSSIITRPRRVRRILRTDAMRELQSTSQDTSTINNTIDPLNKR